VLPLAGSLATKAAEVSKEPLLVAFWEPWLAEHCKTAAKCDIPNPPTTNHNSLLGSRTMAIRMRLISE